MIVGIRRIRPAKTITRALIVNGCHFVHPLSNLKKFGAN
jgi:hypothetical protein